MPTSVLLAILAGAGLLALAPALVRRYDADERAAADREESQARVLRRGTRDRTGPGSQPLNPPSESADAEDEPEDEDAPEPPESDAAAEPDSPKDAEDTASTGWERSGVRRGESVRWTSTRSDSQGGGQEVSVSSARLRAWRRQRYRRVLYVLVALNLIELIGVIVIGPGFWVGVALSVALLGCYVWFLRSQVTRRQRPGTGISPAKPAGRAVYVPAQSEGESEDPEPEESARGLVPGFGDDDEDEFADVDEDTTESGPPPSRRRTGGIRGRSYESPASL